MNRDRAAKSSMHSPARRFSSSATSCWMNSSGGRSRAFRRKLRCLWSKFRETYRLGGSGNVAANIRALDGIPIPIGVIGRDAARRTRRRLLDESRIETTGLVQADRPTTLKTRIIAHNQQVVRADRESRKPLRTGIEPRSDGLVSAISAASSCRDCFGLRQRRRQSRTDGARSFPKPQLQASRFISIRRFITRITTGRSR